MLGELRKEQAQIEDAILTIERLARGGQKRRGRPPKWMADLERKPSTSATPRKRAAFSAETRTRMSSAQKARWATKQKTA